MGARPVGDAVLTRVHDLPEGFDRLVEESLEEGFGALARMQAAWAAGRNRFDRQGEGLWTATREGSLLGIGGLNRDPFLDDPSVGRLRHLYVARTVRRAGIGRALVAVAVEHARGRFAWLRLRTRDAGAARFYEALGFTPPPPVLGADATHALRLGED